MAKTANSKVIFLPAQNQTVQSQMAQADAHGEGPSSYANGQKFIGGQNSSTNEFGFDASGMQSATNAGMVQNI